MRKLLLIWLVLCCAACLPVAMLGREVSLDGPGRKAGLPFPIDLSPGFSGGAQILKLWEDHKLEAALKAAQHARATGAAEQRRRLMVGELLLELHRPGPAAEVLATVGSSLPEIGDHVITLRGQALMDAGRPEDALAVLATLPPDSPLAGRTSRLIARSELNRNQPARSLEVLARLLSETPVETLDAPTLLLAADASAKLATADGDRRALELYHAIRVYHPLNGEAKQAAAGLKALASRGIKPVPDTPAELYATARVYLTAFLNEEAVARLQPLFESVPATDPLRCDVSFSLGMAFQNLRRYTEAESPLTAAGQACTADRDKQVKALYVLGRGATRKGDLPQADVVLRDVATRFPDHSYADDALFLLGVSYLDKGELDKGVGLLEEQIKRYPLGDMRSEATWRLAWSAYRKGKLETAIARVEGLLSDARMAALAAAQGAKPPVTASMGAPAAIGANAAPAGAEAGAGRPVRPATTTSSNATTPAANGQAAGVSTTSRTAGLPAGASAGLSAGLSPGLSPGLSAGLSPGATAGVSANAAASPGSSAGVSANAAASPTAGGGRPLRTQNTSSSGVGQGEAAPTGLSTSNGDPLSTDRPPTEKAIPPPNLAREAYWRARWLELKDPKRRDAVGDAYETLIRWSPVDFYSVLAMERLKELSPARARAVSHEVDRPKKAAEASIDLDAQPAAVRRSIELLRCGLKSRAVSELAPLMSASMDSGDMLVSNLLEHADRYDLSHRIPRAWLDRAGQVKVDAASLPAWLLAYPPAYEEEIQTAASGEEIDPMLLMSLAREESAFDASIRSFAGAVGLVQIMPTTADVLAKELKQKVATAQLTIPEVNLKLSAHYVHNLLEMFSGHPGLAVPSYNAGEGAVGRWLKQRGTLPFDEFVEEIPYKQTRDYTKRVLETFQIYHYLYRPKQPFVSLDLQIPTERKTKKSTADQ